VTRLQITRSRNQGSSSSKIKSFTFFTASRLALEPILPPIQCAPGPLFPMVKQPGRETDHSSPSSAEIKNVWTYTSTPYTSLWLKHRDTFSAYRYLQKFTYRFPYLFMKKFMLIWLFMTLRNKLTSVTSTCFALCISIYSLYRFYISIAVNDIGVSLVKSSPSFLASECLCSTFLYGAAY
jgi:hypothetical protein